MSDEPTPGSPPTPEQPDGSFNQPEAAKPSTEPKSPEPDAKPPEEMKSIWGYLARLLQIIFTPITWIMRPLVFRVSHERGNPKVYFTSFSTLMYLWPITVIGWLGVLLSGDWVQVSPSLLGWLWITVLLVVILCIGSDTDRNKTIVLAMVVGLLWLGGLLLEAKKGIPILSHVYDYLAAKNVAFEPGTASVFSLATLIILLMVVFAAWFDGRYEITTREITHKRVFRTSDSLPRAAKRIKRDWRDLTEVILGLGAGDVIVLDSNKNIVMRIPNVPFLWFFRHDVDHILEVLATTDVDDIAAIEEEELG